LVFVSTVARARPFGGHKRGALWWRNGLERRKRRRRRRRRRRLWRRDKDG
jgi:hypothetical protein